MKQTPSHNGISMSDVGGRQGLEALQSEDQKRYLDAIDQLRACGFERDLPLPQLVVCGDQSAGQLHGKPILDQRLLIAAQSLGKSSVLEALTEISFPRADNTCTRHATEIIMRHAPRDSVTVSITPGPDRSKEEEDMLRKFSRAVDDLDTITSDLGSLIKSAKDAMGIFSNDNSLGSRGFSRDTLRIEIAGPERSQFTVVDLPGIFSNEKRSGDRQLVYDLTHQFIDQKRTICLAVVAASSDADNQPILTEVRNADKDGIRSLGIITKPDKLDKASGSEQFWVDLAKNDNADYFFKHGWHVLRNRNFEEESYSFAQRNEKEQTWYRGSKFKDLPSEDVGIHSLRVKLSHLLFEHVKRELPAIQKDLQDMTKQTREEMDRLGQSRSTPEHARSYLTFASERIQRTCRAALDSSLSSDFFKRESLTGFNSQSPRAVRRLRALTRKENSEFAELIRESGHTLNIQDEVELDVDDKTFLPTDELAFMENESTLPVEVSYREAITWVSIIREQSVGCELQGTFNPLIIGELFWYQSKAWKGLADGHIDHVSSLCNDFMRQVLDECCAEDVKNALWDQHVVGVLAKRDADARDELREKWKSYRDEPMSEDAAYVAKVEARRRKRIDPNIKAIKELLTVNNDFWEGGSDGRKTERLWKHVNSLTAASTDPVSAHWFSCEQALDCLMAIYDIKRETFIEDFLSQVVNMNMLNGLDEVITPGWISRLSPEQIQRLAFEPENVQRYREHLRTRLERLDHGQNTLKGVWGGVVISN